MIWSNPRHLERMMYASLGIVWGFGIMASEHATIVSIFAPLIGGAFAGYAFGWLNRRYPNRNAA